MKTILLKTLAYFALAMVLGGLLALIVLVAKGEEESISWNLVSDTTEWVSIHRNKTNGLPTSSALITNVVSGDNGTGCRTCFESNKGLWGGAFSMPAIPGGCPDKRPYSPPTARWTITTIIRRDTLNVTWRGKDFPLVDEKQVSSVTNYEVLAQTWVKTNAPPVIGFDTNGLTTSSHGITIEP